MRILHFSLLVVCLGLLGGSVAWAAADDATSPKAAEKPAAATPAGQDAGVSTASDAAVPTPLPPVAKEDKPAAATPAGQDAGVSTASDAAGAPPPPPPAKENTPPAKAAPPEPPKTEPPKTEPPKVASPKAEAPKAAPKKQLTAAQVELRDRVRRTLEAQLQQPFNTRDNTAADLIKFCWAFGCRSEVERGDAPGQKVNAVTCLCWDLPCGGYHLLALDDGRIAARVGYGLQDDPAQFLAMLALAHVPTDYPLRAGKTVRTVADLVESEKRACRSGADMSLKLVGLSHYAGQETWKNSLDEDWSIKRMVASELARPPVAGPGGITRLLGLSCALNLCARSETPLDGAFGRAKAFVDDYRQYVLRSQNSDGSWSFRPVAGQAPERDYAWQFLATGEVAEWLALSVPATALEDPTLVRSIEYLDSMLNSERYRGSTQGLSSRDLAAMAHAMHALAVYDARVFQPADPEPGKEAKPVATAASGQAAAVQ
ncbi:MAG: hypothetical protein ACLQLG_09005 [Thermoguttaceae bacterium]